MSKPKIAKSETSHAVLDEASRLKKAKKIVAVLDQEVNLKNASVLDIGTGSGHIPHVLGKRAKHVDSVDLTDERMLKTGYKFHKVDDEALPYEDRSFDVVVSNQVVEHVPNQRKHFAEIERVLKPGGVAYLATPNKYWLVDPHHRLYFISWLPRPLAASYLKRAKGKAWDIYPLSWHQIRNHTRGKFELDNAVGKIIKRPKDYELNLPRSASMASEFVPLRALNLLTMAAPSFIVLLRKPKYTKKGK